MKYACRVLAFLGLIFCASCTQEDITTVISDAAEVGVFTAFSLLPAAEAIPLASAAIEATDTLVIATLNDVNSTASLQDVLNLVMLTDPALAKYKTIISFIMPVLTDIPGVQAALTTAVNAIPVDVKEDVLAFFNGAAAGCQDFSGGMISQDLQKKIKKAQKRFGDRFNLPLLRAKLAAPVKN